MQLVLTEKEIKAIEKVINQRGKTEAVVRADDGKIVIIQVDRKKVV